MKKVNEKLQETFDFFPSLNKWPDGYHDFIPKESLNYPIFGMDCETEGLNTFNKDRKIKSIAISPLNALAFSMHFSSYNLKGDNSLTNFISLCERSDVILIGHNIKYDINWISVKLGITVKCMLFDTMFAQYLLDENVEHNSLQEAIDKYLDRKEFGSYKKDIDFDKMSRDDLLILNCKDADASRRLYDVFVPKLKKEGMDKLMITSSMVLPVLSKMETKGVWLDKEYAYKTQTKLFNELVQLRYNMSDIVDTPFNPDSSQSLGAVLYKTLGFTPQKQTPSGANSTDSEAIGYLVDQVSTEQQNQFLDSILSYKKKIKLITTYYQPIERWTRYDGRVHTSYNLGRQRNEEGSGGTVTGRLSSNNPNLQNIPRGKEHRGMFAASEGFTLLDGDFSQLELRVAAFLSQEPAMIHAFANGLDIHTSVMSGLTGIPYDDLEAILKDSSCKEYAKIKNDRVAFKEVNFGIFYGMSAKRLQRTLRVKAGIRKNLDECQEYIDAWFAKYSKAKEWLDKTKLFAVSHKYVSMPLGQKRRLPDAEFSYAGSSALRQATNFPVQSLASWICLIGLKLLDDYYEDIRKLGYECNILMQVHDSVTSEIKIPNYNNTTGNVLYKSNIKRDVKQIMEKDTTQYIKEVFGVDFNIPLVFDLEYKDRWS